MEITFVDYQATPQEKYLGIATVNFNNVLYLRYKIVQGKDGAGYFPAISSYKVDDHYVPTFVIDSNMTKQKIERIIRTGVDAALFGTNQEKNIAPSAFSGNFENETNIPF